MCVCVCVYVCVCVCDCVHICLSFSQDSFTSNLLRIIQTMRPHTSKSNCHNIQCPVYVLYFCVIYDEHTCTHLLPCVRMLSRVMCLVASVCVYIYICVYVCQQQNRLFSALLLENLLLNVMRCLLFEFKHLRCGLLHSASCTDRVIHAFPNKTRRFLGPEIFSSGLHSS